MKPLNNLIMGYSGDFLDYYGSYSLYIPHTMRPSNNCLGPLTLSQFCVYGVSPCLWLSVYGLGLRVRVLGVERFRV